MTDVELKDVLPGDGGTRPPTKEGIYEVIRADKECDFGRSTRDAFFHILAQGTASIEGQEDVLISFEEWKSKQFQAHSHTPVHSRIETPASDGMSKNSGQHTEMPPVDEHAPPPTPCPRILRTPSRPTSAYPSRTESTRPTRTSPSAILSSTKDKYMLSPCTTKHGEAQFVVVELLGIQGFLVSVAKKYTGRRGWTLAGTYRGKNVRGVQSFHLPTSLRDFYRARVWLPRLYVPLIWSQDLEEWKWETWEAESCQRWKDAGVQQAFITEGSLPSKVQSPKVVPTEDIKAFMDKLNTVPIRPGVPASLPPEGTSTVSLKSPSSSASMHSQSHKGVSASVVGEQRQTCTSVVFPATTQAAVSKADPHTSAVSFRQSPKAFKSAFASTLSLSKRSHTPSILPYANEEPSSRLKRPHTLPRAHAITRFDSLITSAHPGARSAKRWARTTHLHEVKAAHERRGSGSGKRADKDGARENDGPSLEVFRNSTSAPLLLASKSRRSSRPFANDSETAQTVLPLSVPSALHEETVRMRARGLIRMWKDLMSIRTLLPRRV
ncbi:hypothetical protein BU15DRAFT_80309 [Melanogaster broomeanus]|nr:hypothetical protein BU15DRAFT_80309 [Melanogaster broomeanus]